MRKSSEIRIPEVPGSTDSMVIGEDVAAHPGGAWSVPKSLSWGSGFLAPTSISLLATWVLLLLI